MSNILAKPDLASQDKSKILIVLGFAIFFGACNYTNQANTSSVIPITPSVTASPTPTPSKSLNELNLELNSTVDDGGQADLNQLQKDSSGL